MYSNKEPSIPTHIDPKMIWYSIKDRYSLDFEAVTHYLDVIKQNNFNTSNPEQFEILSSIIDYIKTQFNSTFLSIKGGHILNKMELSTNPTLNSINPFNFKTEIDPTYINLKLLEFKTDLEEQTKDYKWFIECNSILDILVQNIEHNSDHDKLNNDEVTRRTHEACLHVYHYLHQLFQSRVKILTDNKEGNANND